MPAAPEPPPVRVGAILAQVGFVVVAALLVYGFVAVTKDGELRRVCSAPSYLRPDYLGADRRAPDFTLKDLRGAEVSLASLRGKVVVLNFWTKTCGPCLEEMPDLAELAVILRDRPDVVVVTVSTDAGPEDVKPTLQTVLKGDAPLPGALRSRSRRSSRASTGRIFSPRRGSSTSAASSAPASTARASGTTRWS